MTSWMKTNDGRWATSDGIMEMVDFHTISRSDDQTKKLRNELKLKDDTIAKLTKELKKVRSMKHFEVKKIIYSVPLPIRALPLPFEAALIIPMLFLFDSSRGGFFAVHFSTFHHHAIAIRIDMSPRLSIACLIITLPFHCWAFFTFPFHVVTFFTFPLHVKSVSHSFLRVISWPSLSLANISLINVQEIICKFTFAFLTKRDCFRITEV